MRKGLGADMPKMKTHKGSKKRFRVTANDLLRRHQAGKRHLNSHKSGARKRQLRDGVVDGGKIASKYVINLCGQA